MMLMYKMRNLSHFIHVHFRAFALSHFITSPLHTCAVFLCYLILHQCEFLFYFTRLNFAILSRPKNVTVMDCILCISCHQLTGVMCLFFFIGQSGLARSGHCFWWSGQIGPHFYHQPEQLTVEPVCFATPSSRIFKVVFNEKYV